MNEELDCFYKEFKEVVDNQNFTKNRIDCFTSLFRKLPKENDFVSLEAIMADQLGSFFKYHIIKQREIVFKNTDKLDQVAESLLIKSNVNLIDINPVQIVGDGNCFYRSISKALYGSQEYHYEIRYRTLMEMVLNKKLHVAFLETFSDNSQPNWFLECAPGSNNLNIEQTLIEQIFECARPNHFSTLIHIYATSQALKIHIDQIYPSIAKAKLVSMIEFLNKTIECNYDEIHVKIVWSHASSDDLCKKFPSWNANHFVCMLPFKKNYYKDRLNQIISIQKRPLSTSSQVNDHFLKKTKKELEKKDTLKSSSRISFISDSSFNSLVSLNNNFSDESVYVEQRESYYDTDQSDDSIDSSEKASEIDSVKEKNDESLLQSEVELTSLQLAELSVHDHKIVKGSNASTFEYGLFTYCFRTF